MTANSEHSLLTDQIFERCPVMCHQIVNDCSPGLDARHICLEEARIHHQLECLALPCTTCVLVATEARQHLRARPVAWQIVNAGHMSHTLR